MKSISLYIHIPFCRQKCRYCDFPSYSGKEPLMREYLNILSRELSVEASKYTYNTVFIGGGTPSYLNETDLEFLLSEIRKLTLNEGNEFTVECNPGSINLNKLKIMKKYGVNRLSFGLQSAEDRILLELGRIHTFEEFENNFKTARNAGFQNINIDLMFGLPNQSLKDFKDTLMRVVEMDPEHISAYSLIVEEGTVFYKLDENGQLSLPSEEEEREMYEYCVDFLKSKGYIQYEISNFAKEGKECRHNKVYWNLDEYLGCGASSASYIDGKRIKNIEEIEGYIDAMSKSGSAAEDTVYLKDNDMMEEFMFLGLRKTQGVSECEFERRFNKNIDDIYGSVINYHVKEVLLIREKGIIYLSRKGIQLSNYVMKDFLLDK